ncbi:MAG: hypothetical protein Q7T57_07485 [Dehalococcoidales bacterium]|nr:hypothetical protein [Dehalococcoidales bacterium]
MIRKILALGLVFIIVLTMFAGCSGSSKETPTGKYEILRKAVLGGKWQMYQFRLKMEPGSEFDIDLLDLVIGDKVDGYFYPETENGATVEIIAGANVIYKIEPAGIPAGGTMSDRFSFVANQPLGTAHVLKFTNNGTEKTVSVFVEIIYPTTGKIRGPLDVK